MPELPSVERARRCMHDACVGQGIANVTIVQDELVFVPSATAIEKALTGNIITTTHRKGKHFWVTLNTQKHVAFHLGMTGEVVVRGTDRMRYGSQKSSVDKDTWPPRAWKLLIELADGTTVAFVNSRR